MGKGMQRGKGNSSLSKTIRNRYKFRWPTAKQKKAGAKRCARESEEGGREGWGEEGTPGIVTSWRVCANIFKKIIKTLNKIQSFLHILNLPSSLLFSFWQCEWWSNENVLGWAKKPFSCIKFMMMPGHGLGQLTERRTGRQRGRRERDS